ncbi:TonB-dependent receptor plug domain-containing protein [Serratia marcescens]|uniref:TonB-dependent receptor plug domain-containing protein n=1 Tax=Serratia marcescens TaxID=615 RepID=A0A939NQA2_SERMA|nr:TonB-dependent receptor plug domain-containing protein [Serratia marcescens]
MPDGRGQTSNIDINSVERIEVLRGPYSALYGNASGGVINVDTQTGASRRWKPAAISAATTPALRGESDRRHRRRHPCRRRQLRYFRHPIHHSGLSRSQRRAENLGNGKLGVRTDDVSTLTLMFNSVSIDAGDPGGLTEAEWRANPRRAPRADQFNTRKSLDQTQPACAISAG